MNQRITLQDVAHAAGVSTATVSRVLSRPDVVRASTRERVMAAVRQHDYQPDAAARALASGRTHTVGCVIPTQDLGRITALSVLSAIAGDTIADRSLLPFELVVRGSTAPPIRR
jgi:DNA-binding LacI/PurR family transcriptional regulator